jgi:heat shock protein HtpX
MTTQPKNSVFRFVFNPSGEAKDMSGFHRLILAMMLGVNDVEKVTAEKHPVLFESVQAASEKAGYAESLPAYVYTQPKGYANAAALTALPFMKQAIVFSDTLPHFMSKQEITAVVGHELGHAKGTGVRVPLMIAGSVGAEKLYADTIGNALHHATKNKAPTLRRATGITSAVAQTVVGLAAICAASRYEEYAADRYGAYIAGDAKPLITGLEKLKAHNEAIAEKEHGAPSGWQKGLKIVGMFLNKPFETHPDNAKRAEALGVDIKEIRASLPLQREESNVNAVVPDIALYTVAATPKPIIETHAMMHEQAARAEAAQALQS